MKQVTVTFLVLAATWLAWSGHWEPENDSLILAFGVVSCLLVVWLSGRLDASDGSNPGWGLGLRPLLYAPWLGWEIVKANLDITRMILHPQMPIRPRLMRVRASQKTELGQVIYANSITLTPGTVTLDVRSSSFLVHALTDGSADGLDTGDMDQKVCWLEGSR